MPPMLSHTETLARVVHRWWRPLAWGVAVPLCIAGAVGWRNHTVGSGGAAPPVALGAPLDPPAAPMALVFVSGAVVNPGLYRVSAAARGVDAIAAAGGLSADADLGRLPDLAARVHDGRQLNVPFQRGSAGGTSTTGSVARLDVNSATLEELQAVPGMPAGLPEAILEHRTNWGPFLSLADLSAALGLDRQASAALRPFLRVVVPR